MIVSSSSLMPMGDLGGSIDLLRLKSLPSLHGKPPPTKPANRGSDYCNCETPRRAPGNARGASGTERDRVDLDVHTLAGRGGLHRGARGLHALEVLLEDPVEHGEVVHVPQVDADSHHVGDGRPARLEHLSLIHISEP